MGKSTRSTAKVNKKLPKAPIKNLGVYSLEQNQKEKIWRGKEAIEKQELIINFQKENNSKPNKLKFPNSKYLKAKAKNSFSSSA